MSPPTRGALTANLDLKVPLLSRSSYFQSSYEAGQWKKEEEGGHKETESASYLHVNAIYSHAYLAVKAFT